MGFTFAEKLRESHLVEGQTAPGREIGIRVGQTLTQDATGTMVYLAFEAIGINRVKTQLSASFTDHNILETDSKNVDDHRYLHTTAARFGAVLSPAGNAISHHVHRKSSGSLGGPSLVLTATAPRAGAWA